MKSYAKFFLKIFVFVLLFFGSYYLFILKPRLELPNKLLKAEKTIGEHSSTLIQNRLSFVELTRLDPNSANFLIEKSNVISKLKETNKEGLDLIQKQGSIPEINEELTKRFFILLSETKKIYEEQENLLERVFETKSYEEGVEILKSDEAISLLTRHTNLILEYKFWLNFINGKQEELVYQTVN
jgi:hypothetical protein